MNRAYSVFEIKAADDEKRIIEGIATTPSPDRANDIIELDGIDYKLPLPFLLQHNSRQPIGSVIDAKIVKNEMRVRIQVASAGIAAYIDEAWALIKSGLIRGLSIGFRSIEEAYNKETGGFRFMATEWIELSAVTIPMNAEATITAVKSFDQHSLALSGKNASVVVRLGTNPSAVAVSPKKAADMKIAEQITQFENKRASSVARMDAIIEEAAKTGATLDDAQQQEYDLLDGEVKSIDGHIVRLKAHEKRQAASAAAITQDIGTDPGKAKAAHGGIVTVKSMLPKGIGMARMAICLYNAKGNRHSAAEMAKQYYSDSPEVELELRAAVAALNTTSTTAAGPLVPTTYMQNDFIELLRPATIVGRIPGIRRVPFNISVPRQTGSGTYQWVAQGNKKPVSALAFDTVTMLFTKIAGIVVATKELMKFSNPSAEAVIRDDMVRGIAKYIDEQFTDPTVAAVSGTNPASITNGVTAVSASGTTAAAFRTDFANMIDNFIANNLPVEQVVLLMPANVALNLSLLTNALGGREFPDVGMMGGSILGMPIIISQSVGARIIALIPQEILLADDGPVEIDVSEEASIVMDSAPQSSPQTTSLVSLWQHNYVGIRCDKFINWTKARTTSVEYISNAVYSG